MVWTGVFQIWFHVILCSCKWQASVFDQGFSLENRRLHRGFVLFRSNQDLFCPDQIRGNSFASLCF